MDTVTQVALGAAIGEVTLGRKVGWRAPLWGGICGLAPDLDVLWPFEDAVSAFTWHRGYSHAFFVLALAAPLIAGAAMRVHPATRRYWRGWLLLAFLALITHPVLDCFTVYGTQVWLPFSNQPVGWSTIFIIDPVFSVPLILGVAAARARGGDGRLGHRFNQIGLGLGIAWLALTVAIKSHVNRVTEESLPSSSVARYLTTPSPFNIVLWRVVAMTNEGHFLEGYYSLFDPERTVAFVSRPDGHELLEDLRSEPRVARLIWFSRGFFAGSELPTGDIVVSDLRMGFEGRYVFSFVAGRRVAGMVEPVPVRRRPSTSYPPDAASRLWERLLARSSHPECVLSC